MNFKVSIEINNEKITFITKHGQANDNLSDEQREIIHGILCTLIEQFSPRKELTFRSVAGGIVGSFE